MKRSLFTLDHELAKLSIISPPILSKCIPLNFHQLLIILQPLDRGRQILLLLQNLPQILPIIHKSEVDLLLFAVVHIFDSGEKVVALFEVLFVEIFGKPVENHTFDVVFTFRQLG